MQVEQVEIETVETVDNVIQFAEKASDKNMGTVMNKQGKLVLSIYDLQADLISGGINKFSYILYMIRLLYGSGKDLEITLENLIEILSCKGVTALGDEKKINFGIEDVQIEIAKMAKKGLLTACEIPIQLNVTIL